MSEKRLDTNNITLTTTSNSDFIGYTQWLSTPILRLGYLGENKLPKEYYINEKKKTIVLKWNDDSITKVKVSENDKFDARYGFLVAYFQRHCGMSKTKANKYLESIEKEKE